MAKINDLWDGSMDKHRVHGLVPFCGQDGYRAQVTQLPLDLYTDLTSTLALNFQTVIHIKFLKKNLHAHYKQEG